MFNKKLRSNYILKSFIFSLRTSKFCTDVPVNNKGYLALSRKWDNKFSLSPSSLIDKLNKLCENFGFIYPDFPIQTGDTSWIEEYNDDFHVNPYYVSPFLAQNQPSSPELKEY